jgi:toxin ParE1/3/4
VKIRWLSLAEADLEAVEKYISKENPTKALLTVLHLIEAVEILVNHPGIGRPGRVAGTKELVVPDTPYIIPYRKQGDYIEILRVFHQARKWPDVF